MSEFVERWLPKPGWCKEHDYLMVLRSHPSQACVEKDCGEDRREFLSIDHVIPRYLGGTDDWTNLTVRCRRCNARKGTGPDSRWAQTFFWDQKPNLDNVRTPQLQLWDRIVNDPEFWTQPLAVLARILFMNAWVVGAGKSLGIAISAFALNHVVRREWGDYAPRNRRILVLAKEAAIRDALAITFAGDLVRYGIVPVAPRVAVIDPSGNFARARGKNEDAARVTVLGSGSLLKNEKVVENFDVVCSCIQTLWEKNESHDENLSEILSWFQMHHYDEPHFANAQVMKLVDKADRSVSMGWSATPIEASGEIYRHVVLCSLYDYRDAVTNDQSLKYLGDSDEALAETFIEVTVNEADVSKSGVLRKIQDTSEEVDYVHNILPAISVAKACVDFARECDDERQATGGLFNLEMAPHRPPDSVPTLWYPMHCLIKCRSVEAAKMIVLYLNELFEGNRDRYPEEWGYQAAVVHADRVEGDTQVAGEALTPDHPWLRYRFTGKLGKDCCRFLIVVGIGREGLDNRYCGCVGMAAEEGSLIEVIQRPIGRAVRAPSEIEPDGKRQVPMRKLDMLRVISHEVFNNRPLFAEAVSYCLHMKERLAGMLTIQDLRDGKEVSDFEAEVGAASLTAQDRLRVLDWIGKARMAGAEPDINRIAMEIGGDSVRKQERALEWCELAVTDPWSAWEMLDHVDRMRSYGVVLWEKAQRPFTDAERRRFVEIRYPEMLEALDSDVPNRPFLMAIDALYRQYQEQYHLRRVPACTNVKAIRDQYAAALFRRLGTSLQGETREIMHQVYRLIGGAVKQIIGTTGSVNTGGEFDRPEYHAVLTSPEIYRSVLGFVEGHMIRKGYCPTLQAAFQSVWERIDEGELWESED